MQVLQLLLQSTEGEDECRQVVAECLGHTALLHADKVLPMLLQQAQVRATGAHFFILLTCIWPCSGHSSCRLPTSTWYWLVCLHTLPQCSGQDAASAAAAHQ